MTDIPYVSRLTSSATRFVQIVRESRGVSIWGTVQLACSRTPAVLALSPFYNFCAHLVDTLILNTFNLGLHFIFQCACQVCGALVDRCDDAQ